MKLRYLSYALVLVLIVVVSMAIIARTADHAEAPEAISKQFKSSFAQVFGGGANKTADLSWSAPETAENTTAQSGSLRGSQIDGHLNLDNRGNFLADHGSIELFEYFWSALGERNSAQIMAEIKQYIDSHLDKQAGEQAWEFMQKYYDYQIALSKQSTIATTPESISASKLSDYADYFAKVLSDRKNLREQIFGAEVSQRIWQDSDLYDRKSIEQLRGNEEAVAQIAATLSPETRTAVNQSSTVIDYQKLADQLRQTLPEGEASERLTQFATQAFGTDAAARLSQVEKEQAEWQQRVDNYLVKRQQIINGGGDKTEQQQQLHDLRQNFSPVEQQRLPAYESLANKKLPSLP